MTATPTPTPTLRIRADVLAIGNALTTTQAGAVRTALLAGLVSLFDSATATPVSDTNGSAPEVVNAVLFTQPESEVPNGLDPAGRD